MAETLKTYRSLKAAAAAAGDAPILKIGCGAAAVYVVVAAGEGSAQRCTDVALLGPAEAGQPGHRYYGYITLGHLNRLGNANHAVESASHQPTPFPWKEG